MNPDYVRIIAASDDDRRGLFAATARRIGTTEQNVEKHFWVCWTLDTLFRQLPAGGPRLLFKGGTSLSKAFGLIDRLSEDIDVTVFRSDLEGRPINRDGDGRPQNRVDLLIVEHSESVMLAPGAAKLDSLHQSQEVRATKKVFGFGQQAAT